MGKGTRLASEQKNTTTWWYDSIYCISENDRSVNEPNTAVPHGIHSFQPETSRDSPCSIHTPKNIHLLIVPLLFLGAVSISLIYECFHAPTLESSIFASVKHSRFDIMRGKPVQSVLDRWTLYEPTQIHVRQGETKFRPRTIIQRVVVTGFEPFGNHMVNPSLLVATYMNGTCECLRVRKFAIFFHREGVSSCAHAICFESIGLPVSHDGAHYIADRLSDPIFQSRYHAILHFGLNSAVKDIQVEIVAANVAAIDGSDGSLPTSTWTCTDDSKGHRNATGPYHPIVDHGPCLIPTTADLTKLDLHKLSKRSYKARQSSGFRNFVQDMVGSGSDPSVSTAKKHKSIPSEFSRDLGSYYCNEIYYQTLYKITSSRIHVLGTNFNRFLLPALFVHIPSNESLHVLESVAFAYQIAKRLVS